MNFTFGIITNNNSNNFLEKILNSIENLSIPNYEILIVGNTNISANNTRVIYFDETLRKSWITKKKNLISKEAIYDNIVYLHDYIVFDKNWYKGFLQYGSDFGVCMTPILNQDGTRFRDWSIWPHNNDLTDQIVINNRQCLIPYDMTHLSKYMYISGSYWIAKKSIMLQYPLDENLLWGEGEDVEWSKRVRKKNQFKCNPFSHVRLLKQKDPAFEIADVETIRKLMLIK
jgi:hypothetical protein